MSDMAQLKRGMKFFAKLGAVNSGTRPAQASEAVSKFQNKVAGAIEAALEKLPRGGSDVLASAKNVFQHQRGIQQHGIARRFRGIVASFIHQQYHFIRQHRCICRNRVAQGRGFIGIFDLDRSGRSTAAGV